MNERRSAGSGVVGYAIVLVGVAGFVLSCFLPYSSFGPANGLSRSSTSYYEVITLGGRTRLQYVGGGLLFLFGGAATVAWVAFTGLRHGQHEHRRMPSVLMAVTVAWSSVWIGLLGRVVSAGFLGAGYEVGYWSMLASVCVVIVGTIVVWVSARHATQEADSAAGPEPPTEVPIG